MKNIITYVKHNYAKLPKSRFDAFECVIVKTINNDDYGYGNHNYEGVGITKDGKVVWCYSSGCSCNGGPWVDEKHSHDKSVKVLVAEYDLQGIDPDETNFESMQVSFDSY